MVNLRQPLQRRKVRIVGHRIEEEQGTGWSPSTRYLVTVADEAGAVTDVAVSEEAFTRLSDGQEGVLQMQGAWFRGFQV
jgi:hypothetical protein